MSSHDPRKPWDQFPHWPLRYDFATKYPPPSILSLSPKPRDLLLTAGRPHLSYHEYIYEIDPFHPRVPARSPDTAAAPKPKPLLSRLFNRKQTTPPHLLPCPDAHRVILPLGYAYAHHLVSFWYLDEYRNLCKMTREDLVSAFKTLVKRWHDLYVAGLALLRVLDACEQHTLPAGTEKHLLCTLDKVATQLEKTMNKQLHAAEYFAAYLSFLSDAEDAGAQLGSWTRYRRTPRPFFRDKPKTPVFDGTVDDYVFRAASIINDNSACSDEMRRVRKAEEDALDILQHILAVLNVPLLQWSEYHPDLPRFWSPDSSFDGHLPPLDFEGTQSQVSLAYECTPPHKTPDHNTPAPKAERANVAQTPKSTSRRGKANNGARTRINIIPPTPTPTRPRPRASAKPHSFASPPRPVRPDEEHAAEDRLRAAVLAPQPGYKHEYRLPTPTFERDVFANSALGLYSSSFSTSPKPKSLSKVKAQSNAKSTKDSSAGRNDAESVFYSPSEAADWDPFASFSSAPAWGLREIPPALPNKF